METIQIIQNVANSVQFTSAPVFMGDLIYYAVGLTFTVAATGTLQVTQSMDGVNFDAGNIVGVSVVGQTFAIATGFSYAPYIAVNWIPAGGQSGFIDGIMTIK